MNKLKMVMVIAVTLVCPARLFSQTNYFVSLHGNDTAPGTQEKPLASISRAVEKARGQSGKINVYLMGGIYHLDRPVVFTSRDSRSNGNALTLASYKNKK